MLHVPDAPTARAAKSLGSTSPGMTWRRVLATAAAMSLAFSACGGGDSSADDAPAAGDGAALYASNCASCHGGDLGGSSRGPSHLSIVYEPNHHGDDAFRSAIVNGARQHHWTFGDMPAVEGLSDDDVEAIIAFVRSEQERRGFEPLAP